MIKYIKGSSPRDPRSIIGYRILIIQLTFAAER